MRFAKTAPLSRRTVRILKPLGYETARSVALKPVALDHAHLMAHTAWHVKSVFASLLCSGQANHIIEPATITFHWSTFE